MHRFGAVTRDAGAVVYARRTSRYNAVIKVSQGPGEICIGTNVDVCEVSARRPRTKAKALRGPDIQHDQFGCSCAARSSAAASRIFIDELCEGST